MRISRSKGFKLAVVAIVCLATFGGNSVRNEAQAMHRLAPTQTLCTGGYPCEGTKYQSSIYLPEEHTEAPYVFTGNFRFCIGDRCEVADAASLGWSNGVPAMADIYTTARWKRTFTMGNPTTDRELIMNCQWSREVSTEVATGFALSVSMEIGFEAPIGPSVSFGVTAEASLSVAHTTGSSQGVEITRPIDAGHSGGCWDGEIGVRAIGKWDVDNRHLNISACKNAGRRVTSGLRGRHNLPRTSMGGMADVFSEALYGRMCENFFREMLKLGTVTFEGHYGVVTGKTTVTQWPSG